MVLIGLSLRTLSWRFFLETSLLSPPSALFRLKLDSLTSIGLGVVLFRRRGGTVRCRLEEAITVRRERNWKLEGFERERGEEEWRGRRRKFRNFEIWAIVEALYLKRVLGFSRNKTATTPSSSPSLFLSNFNFLFLYFIYFLAQYLS